MHMSSFNRFVTDVAVLAVTVRGRPRTPFEDVAAVPCQADEDRDSVSEAKVCDVGWLLVRNTERLSLLS